MTSLADRNEIEERIIHTSIHLPHMHQLPPPYTEPPPQHIPFRLYGQGELQRRRREKRQTRFGGFEVLEIDRYLLPIIDWIGSRGAD